MREITYAGGSFVTSDEIANALLEYAAALSNADHAATVRVPSAGAKGEQADVAVLVGPASQLMAEPVEHDGPAPDGTHFLKEVGERITNLQRNFSYPTNDSMMDWDI